MKSPSSPLAALAAGMNAVGTVLVLLVMLVILLDVMGRLVFNQPLEGTAQIVAMSIAAIVFLQFPNTLRAGRVISADGFLDWLAARSVRAEQWLLALYHLLGGGMFAVVCFHVSMLLAAAWVDKEFYGNVGVFTFPKWPVLAIIAFGCAVMTLQYLVLARSFLGAGRRRVRLMAVDPTTRMLS